MTEQEAITAARRGDPAAFAVLVHIHQGAVYSLCYRMLGQAEPAEDATQETFLKAFARLRSYDPSRPFRTWLLAVAGHHCIDRLRRRRFTWLDIDDEPLAAHPALREQRQGPEEVALQKERAADVQALLETLSAADRAAVVLLYWYGFSYQEIAEAMGTTVSAVKSRLHRARVALAAALSARAGDAHSKAQVAATGTGFLAPA